MSELTKNTEIPEKDRKIIDLFKKHDIHHEWRWDMKTGNLEVNVDGGDWKHDHLFLDWVMEQNGFELACTRPYGEPTGGDWYSAWRVYRKEEAA